MYAAIGSVISVVITEEQLWRAETKMNISICQ